MPAGKVNYFVTIFFVILPNFQWIFDKVRLCIYLFSNFRFAITLWYFDGVEREAVKEAYMAKCKFLKQNIRQIFWSVIFATVKCRSIFKGSRTSMMEDFFAKIVKF